MVHVDKHRQFLGTLTPLFALRETSWLTGPFTHTVHRVHLRPFHPSHLPTSDSVQHELCDRLRRRYIFNCGLDMGLLGAASLCWHGPHEPRYCRGGCYGVDFKWQ